MPLSVEEAIAWMQQPTPADIIHEHFAKAIEIIDRQLGRGYASEHPQLIAEVIAQAIRESA